jgi:thermitase
MRRYHIFWTILILIGILGTSPEQARSETKPSDPSAGTGEQAFAPGRIIVKAEEEAPANAVESLNREYDASIESRLPLSDVEVVDLPKDLSVSEAVERYEASPNVEYAEPDYVVYPEGSLSPKRPNDQYFSQLANFRNKGQSGGTLDADIDAPEAWGITTGSSNAVVAVIDTGVDIGHPDLKANIWTNQDEVAGNGIDDDRNGYVDDVHGWDFHNNDGSVFDAASEDSHGTHVAGTIAGRGNNNIGVAGVSWRAKIMPLKFIGAGNRGYVSDAAEALDYAVAEGVKISNNSYGFYDNCNGCYSQTLLDAINRAGTAGHLFVSAAMNGGSDGTGDDIDLAPAYPASYGSPNIITVAASDQDDRLTSFSNYGAASVDLAAPGLDVLSTLPGNRYGNGRGTSMATPHVSGAAALIKSKYPGAGASEMKSRLLLSVDKKSTLTGKVASGGRLNAAEALATSLKTR